MKTTNSILLNAEHTLYTAKLGLKMYNESKNPLEKMAGLRNMITFARSVTFILQNLKSTEKNFDEWYSAKVEIMKKDELLNHFKNMRNEILKEGQIKFSPVLKINGTLNMDELIKKFEQPPNATRFFIGDELGGSGWEIENDLGRKEKFYVDITQNTPELKLKFEIELSHSNANLSVKNISEAGKYYIKFLEDLINEAKENFL